MTITRPVLTPAGSFTFTQRFARWRRTKVYDFLTALPLIAWFSYCASVAVPGLIDQLALIKIFIETDPSTLPAALALSFLSKAAFVVFQIVLVVLFVIRYVPLARARGLYPRFVALGGTFLGNGILLLRPQELSTALYIASSILTIGGFGLAIWALLYLRRSISILPEARKFVTNGPYALVRHPMYVSEAMASAGIALQYSAPWALLLFGIQCVFQILRLKNEERLLLQVFPEYADYAKGTARLLPGVY